MKKGACTYCTRPFPGCMQEDKTALLFFVWPARLTRPAVFYTGSSVGQAAASVSGSVGTVGSVGMLGSVGSVGGGESVGQSVPGDVGRVGGSHGSVGSGSGPGFVGGGCGGSVEGCGPVGCGSGFGVGGSTPEFVGCSKAPPALEDAYVPSEEVSTLPGSGLGTGACPPWDGSVGSVAPIGKSG